MDLANINNVRKLLDSEGFVLKKQLGQNFLINPEVCPLMAENACNENTGVLEIGPGIGVLTSELAKRAKKVVAIELDERLKKILPKTVGEYANTEIIYGDVMKLDLKEIIATRFEGCESVSVCANLPYYITSPIVMMLLESRLDVNSVTVMVQKEAAERLCAKVGSREAGAVTVAVEYYSEPELLFEVNRNSFLPPPKVDSAVIKLKVRKAPAVTVSDEARFFAFVKAGFAQRRKTLVNTVSNTTGISKEKLREALAKTGLPETARTEALTLQQLAELFEKIY